MKELLTLCTKNVHVTFDNVIKVQNDGVAMGLPLGPVLSDIFMIELEISLLPELTDYIQFWKRYIDDTICYIKVGSVNYILSLLNSFDTNIKFTYELQHAGKLPFLHVLLCRKGKKIYTTVYRKATNNDVYLNWNAFAPISWKRGTLKTLIERAYLICSTDELRNRELEYIEKVFYENNSYPKYVIKQVLQQISEQHNNKTNGTDNSNNNIDGDNISSMNNESVTLEKQQLLVLPYQGKKGDLILKSFKKGMRKILPNNVKPQIAFTGRKVGASFQIKDKTEMKHNHDIVYYNECPVEQCNENYIGETGRRISERIIDHTGRDLKSYVYKHCIETGHRSPDINDFKIIGSNFRKNVFKRKIAEALLIKQLKPTLNKQEKSIELKRFN